MTPLPTAKMENVGVAPGAIWTVTLVAGGDRHWPFWGFVWHTKRLTGSVASPVSAVTVMRAPAWPTFEVATENAPLPVGPGTFTMPVFPIVAARAITSATGVCDADSSTV